MNNSLNNGNNDLRRTLREDSTGAALTIDTPHVKDKVRTLLDKSEAFQELSSDKQQELVRHMTTISEFLAMDPGWLHPETPIRARALAGDDAVSNLKERLAQDPGQVGADFKAGAVREGTRAFRELVDAVDFPDFVSSLIQGVFQAIVDASIQQMEGYTEMLAAVTKSVEQFAKDQISDAQARDYVANRYPSAVTVDTSGAKARLKPRNDEATTEEIRRDFGIYVDLDDNESEQTLVNKAKFEMAQSRQQLLATLVLLGINRIVVTNGRINAKVVFNIEASDYAERTAKASLHDERESQTGVAAATWSPWGAGGAAHSRRHKTTVQSSTVDKSDSNIEAKAQLTGDVRVNFRSDVVPLERMVDRLDLQVLNSKATPPQRTRKDNTQSAPVKA